MQIENVLALLTRHDIEVRKRPMGHGWIAAYNGMAIRFAASTRSVSSLCDVTFCRHHVEVGGNVWDSYVLPDAPTHHNGVKLRQFVHLARQTVVPVGDFNVTYGPDWRIKLEPSVRVERTYPPLRLVITDPEALRLGAGWANGDGAGVLVDWLKEYGHLPH